MRGSVHAVTAPCVFDGVAVHEDTAVVIDGAQIAAVMPRAELPAIIPLREFGEDTWLAPGFIDIQVNGGGDVLFNDEPTPDGARAILAAHRKFGTTALLPTLVSDTAEKMTAALAAVEALAGVEPGVLGFHLEGPFLSPEKAGVHDRSALRIPTADDLATLAAPRRGVTLLTLAPEQVPERFIVELVAAGVRVALGHSMATYAQTRAAMADGLAGFTHLFNAMRPLEAREPGPIAAALESAEAWYGLIVDGHSRRTGDAATRLARRRQADPGTDAMPPVGGTRASFALNGETVTVRDGRCARADGRLAGACLDMASAVRNCVRLLGMPLTMALRFASTHPAEFLGLGDRLGRLAAGYRADMVALDGAAIEVLDTWVAGAGEER
jgi:N-acetylglucosamine-6-phosphate deacetylase